MVKRIESRVADRGGSRVLASNQPCRQGFSAAAGRSEWVWRGVGGRRMTRPYDRARACWEGD
jgi:hypothetical protein